MKPLLFIAIICVWPTLQQAQITERLFGFTADSKQCRVTIQVISNGCTSVSDFRFYRNRDTLTVQRIRPDLCKILPDTISLTFPLAAMDCQGLRSVVLRNELRGKANQRMRLNLKSSPRVTVTSGSREP